MSVSPRPTKMMALSFQTALSEQHSFLKLQHLLLRTAVPFLVNDSSVSLGRRECTPKDAQLMMGCQALHRTQGMVQGHPPENFRGRNGCGRQAKDTPTTNSLTSSSGDAGLGFVVVLVCKCSEYVSL
uniref:Uncharacterized protein n=1 Tax=Myotis myotis TaxID=51298 RepID=A0A7J7TIR9_MYOMY|nr:hypothetical protein mMyoMyo1_009071 [Myotis myotis]